jgi:hypothetical protein
MWPVDPLPNEPKLKLFGFSFASLMKSASVAACRSALTAKPVGSSASWVIGASSESLNGGFFCRLIAWIVLAIANRIV